MTVKTNAVETAGLGKRYGTFWALKDCDVSVPVGSITALVGANGAGKSTLLNILAGLSSPSAGAARIYGELPAQAPEFLSSIGFLAQDIPLYKQLNVNDYLKLGQHMNRNWNAKVMKNRLEELSIPFDRPVGKLSGGQRAQVALALALAKQPRLLILDEPVAALDPLARHDFLKSLSQAAAETDLTVLMSSHLLADLELICDRLIILSNAQVQLCDDIEHVVATHKLLIGPRQETPKLQTAYEIIHETHTARQSTLLVKVTDEKFQGPNWQVSEPTIEEIVLAYMGQTKDEAKNEAKTEAKR